MLAASLGVLSLSTACYQNPPHRCSDGAIVRDVIAGASPADFRTGQDHASDEPELGRDICDVAVNAPRSLFAAGLGNPAFLFFDVQVATAKGIGQIYPEWVPVAPSSLAQLDGVVTGEYTDSSESQWPHVAFEDWPTSHYTHDFTFHVRPDDDEKFLLGWRVPTKLDDPCENERSAANTPGYPPPSQSELDRLRSEQCAIHRVFNRQQAFRQPSIEVEWETGLAASNDGNPCAHANDYNGNSCGFFTAGHRRREVIWNWPTVNDRVHVFGDWIWDRGHPPAATEIHPPRLVAIERHLPVRISDSDDPIEPGPQRLTRRIDLYGSGDGGALSNNRSGVRGFVKAVPMNDRDYHFRVFPLPRPSATARLRVRTYSEPGDTFPNIETNVVEDDPAPYVDVTVPWNSNRVANSALLAKSMFLTWHEGTGVLATYQPHVFRVTFDDVFVHKSQDFGGDGEYRLFVEAGGYYLFVNELVNDLHDILSDGLGNTGDDEPWGIHDRRAPGQDSPFAFNIYVPPGEPPPLSGGGFRVYGGGWEADGVNESVGKLLDPNSNYDTKWADFLRDNILDFWGTGLNGCRDDPIGEVNVMIDYPPGTPADIVRGSWSGGPAFHEDLCPDTDQNFSFQLHYRVEQRPWP